MTTNHQSGGVDAHAAATIGAAAFSLEADRQAIVRDVLAAGDSRGGAGSVACHQLGDNAQVVYQQANADGKKPKTAGATCPAPTARSVPIGRNRM